MLFRRGPRGAEPVWYPLSGAYDRYGAIDEGPAIAVEVSLLRARVTALRGAGRFAHRGVDLASTTALFALLEPNGNVATLDGAPLTYALIEQRIAGALVNMLPEGERAALDAMAPERAFARAFRGLNPLAAYDEALAQSPAFRPGLRGLMALRGWADKRQPWSVMGASEQHSGDDEARFAREARSKLARWPELLDVVYATATR